MLITMLFATSHIAVTLLFFVGFSLVSGAIMTFTLNRRFRRERLAVGDVPLAVENAAHKAVMRGPVPTDPEVRAATLRLAEHQLGLMIKWRPLVVVGFTLATVASVIGAFESPWRLLVAACYVPLLIGQWRWPKRLRRRIHELAEPRETPTPLHPTDDGGLSSPSQPVEPWTRSGVSGWRGASFRATPLQPADSSPAGSRRRNPLHHATGNTQSPWVRTTRPSEILNPRASL